MTKILLHIFWRGHEDKDFIHTTIPAPENVDLKTLSLNDLMRMAVAAEFAPGGAYHYDEDDDIPVFTPDGEVPIQSSRQLSINETIAINEEKGYDIVMSILAEENAIVFLA